MRPPSERSLEATHRPSKRKTIGDLERRRILEEGGWEHGERGLQGDGESRELETASVHNSFKDFSAERTREMG